MLVKILYVLLILHASFEQSNLNIELKGGEKELSCSKDIGKIEFTLDYTTSSLIDELDSYFLIKFKDSSKQKHYAICKIYISENEIEPYEEKPITYIEVTTNKPNPTTYIEKITNVPKTSRLIESTVNKPEPNTYSEVTTNKPNPTTYIEKTTNESKPSTLIESTINKPEPTTYNEPSTNPSEPTTYIETTTNESKLSTLIESTINNPEPTTYIEVTTKKPNPTTYIEKSTKESKPSTLIESTLNMPEPTTYNELSTNPNEPTTFIEKSKLSTLIESTINNPELTTYNELGTNPNEPTTFIEKSTNEPKPSTLIESTINEPDSTTYNEPSTNPNEPTTFIEKSTNELKTSTLFESTINEPDSTTYNEPSTNPNEPTTFIETTTNEPKQSTLIEPTSNVPQISIFDTEPPTLIAELSTFEVEPTTFEIEPTTYIPDYSIYELLEKLRETFEEKLKQFFANETRNYIVTTFPWIANFEDNNSLVGFTLIDADKDNNNWELSFTTDSEGNYIYDGYIRSKSVVNQDNWMILPPFSTPINATNFEISWYDSIDIQNEAKYTVYISNIRSFIQDLTTPLLEVATGDWVRKTIDLSSYAGQTINIAFRHYNTTGEYFLKIRNIRVEQILPITNYPWFVDFESSNALEGFTLIDADNDGNNWEHILTNEDGYGHGHGHGHGYIALTLNNNQDVSPNNWMILPTFILPSDTNQFEISWYDKVLSEDDELNYSVYISNTTRNIENFTTPVFEITAKKDLSKKKIDLSPMSDRLSISHSASTKKKVIIVSLLMIFKFVLFIPGSQTPQTLMSLML